MMMEKKDFLIQFEGLINLLKDHNYLRYKNTCNEYSSKLKSCMDAFVTLVKKYTGINLPENQVVIPLETVTDMSINGVKRLVSKVIILYKQKANKITGNPAQQEDLIKTAQLWTQVNELLK